MACTDHLSPTERRELARFAEPLRPAVQDFIRTATSADEFEAQFLKSFQLVTGIPSEPVAETLNQMFFAVDDYVGHGMTVDHSAGDLDGGQLLARAKEFAELAGFEV